MNNWSKASSTFSVFFGVSVLVVVVLLFSVVPLEAVVVVVSVITAPFEIDTSVFVPNTSVAKVSINWFGKLKAAELSLVASLKAKADISDLIGCKSVSGEWVTTEALFKVVGVPSAFILFAKFLFLHY